MVIHSTKEQFFFMSDHGLAPDTLTVTNTDEGITIDASRPSLPLPKVAAAKLAEWMHNV